MQYLPYEKTDSLANIIVDGKANKSTVLSLSHWKDSGTPADLKEDLSAAIVFKYLDRRDFNNPPAEIASNNHFDEDGLVGLYTLLNPHEAIAKRELLIDIASAGDFGTYKLRDAARVCFVLRAWQDPQRSPLKEQIFSEPYPQLTAVLYEELLPRLAQIITKIDQFEQHWSRQDELLDDSEAALRKGDIEIEEIDDLDLAVVTTYGVKKAADWPKNIHEFAIHNATDKLRILMVAEQQYQLYYRYETWVELHSRVTEPRVDLTNLAADLTEMENGQGAWQFTGCDALNPTLKLVGSKTSKISLPQLREKLETLFTANRIEAHNRN